MNAWDATLDAETHVYSDADGKVVPVHATGMIGDHGLGVDYDDADPDVLEEKRIIGVRVDEAAALLDLELATEGKDGLAWECLQPREVGFLKGYKQFLIDHGFVANPHFTQRHVIGEFGGMRYGCTPDRVGKFPKKGSAIVELKCCAKKHYGWRVQTALQEIAMRRAFGVAGVTTCSLRFALQLFEDGKYKLDAHTDNVDYDIAKMVLSLAYFKRGALNGRYPLTR